MVTRAMNTITHPWMMMIIIIAICIIFFLLKLDKQLSTEYNLSKFKVLIDINECLSKFRKRKEFRKNVNKDNYILMISDDIVTASTHKVQSLIGTIYNFQPEFDISYIFKSYSYLICEYDSFIKIRSEQGSWGADAHKSEKPGHILLSFILDSRTWRIERFMGEPTIDDNGVGYHYCVYKLYIDGQLMLHLRKYGLGSKHPARDSVAVLEAHMDSCALTDLRKLADLCHYLQKLKGARERRDRDRDRRLEKARKRQEKAKSLNEQQFLFESFSRMNREPDRE